jgi:uncharacterized protein YegL
MILQIQQSEPTAVQLPTNHIFVVDCSGSMSGELPRLRESLKNKIASLIGENDLLSIIYFSGRNQSDFVFDNYNVKNVSDLSNVKTGIDRWLKPIGLTAFQKPLELAVTRVNKSYLNNLVFMTDGYNNDCPIQNVFTALEQVKTDFDSTFFIEFGYYADSKLLAEMAEKTGGAVVVAENLENLSIQVENGLKSVTAAKVEVTGLSTDYVFGVSNNEVITYKVENGVAYVAGGTTELHYGQWDGTNTQSALILIYGLFSLGRFNQAEELIFKLGDKELIETFVKAYGKQKINSFKQLVAETIRGERDLFCNGRVTNYTIDENAYTVLNLLNDLTGGDNLLYTNHEDFNYKRIGSKRVAKTVLSSDVKDLLAEAKTTEDIDAALAGLKPVEFVANDPNGGVALSSLTFNSSRANINLTVSTQGKVINVPKNKWNYSEYPTWITRAYTICKDGILNVTQLPVSLDAATYDTLKTNGVVMQQLEPINGKEVYLIDFSNLPIVNRSMLKELNASDFVALNLKLEEQKSAQKVYRYYNDKLNPKSTVADSELNDFLKSIGVTYNGYNPSSVKAESTDVYYAPVLDTKFAGLSSLPAVEAVIAKRESGKTLNLADRLMLKYIDLYNTTMKATNNDPMVLKNLTDATIRVKRATEFEVAKNVMALILSRGWFADKEGFEDNKVTLTHPEFGVVEATLKYEDEEVKI